MIQGARARVGREEARENLDRDVTPELRIAAR
jgi:hypothetical protein